MPGVQAMSIGPNRRVKSNGPAARLFTDRARTFRSRSWSRAVFALVTPPSWIKEVSMRQLRKKGETLSPLAARTVQKELMAIG